MTLATAIARLQTIATNAGAKYAPDHPVERPGVYPFSIAYPSIGRYTAEAYSQAKDFHTIAVEIHCAPRSVLPLAVETAIPMLDDFGHRVTADPTLNGTVDTVLFDEGISYTFGVMPWGDMEDIGFKFLIQVKIRSAVTST